MIRLRKFLWMFLVPVGSVVALGFGALWYLTSPDGPRCVSDTESIARNAHGDKVKRVDEVCDNFGHSATTSLYIQDIRGSASPAFFTYVSYEFAPHVTWLSPSAIAIDIPKVDEIYTKLDQMNGIRIHYTIGHTGK